MNTLSFRGLLLVLMCGTALSACNGAVGGVLPGARISQGSGMHTAGVITFPNPRNGGNSGICSPTTGLDCHNQPPVSDPGPMPGENGCDPSAGDTCGGGIIAQGSDCSTAHALNTSVNGNSDHNDMISNVFEWWTQYNGVSMPFAFEYQTYGSQEYMQFFTTLGATGGASMFQVGVSTTQSPIVPFNGSVASALGAAAGLAKLAASALPAPLNTLAAAASGAQAKQSTCNRKTLPVG